MLVFPNCQYDDQVDSFVQFLSWVTTRRAPHQLLSGRTLRLQSPGRHANVVIRRDIARQQVTLRRQTMTRRPSVHELIDP